MPRVARREISGTVYHAASRFIDHRFELDDSTRASSIERLGRVFQRRTDWRVLAYAFMSNHWHVVCVAGRQPSSSWTRPLNVSIAHLVQRARIARGTRPLGAVFAARPTMVAVPKERLAQVMSYVHLNPVRARVVPQPGDSHWTSHAALTGSIRPPEWLDWRTALSISGFGVSRAERERFDRFVCAMSGTQSDILEWNERAVANALRATRRVAGANATVAAPILDPVRGVHLEIGTRDPNWTPPAAPGDPLQLVRAIAMTAGVSVASICSGRKDRAAVECRKLALQFWASRGGRTADMARALGVHPATAYSLSRTGRCVGPIGEKFMSAPAANSCDDL